MPKWNRVLPVSRAGDVERQADDGEVQVGAAANAALEGLIRQLVADAVDRAPVDERLDAEAADR